VSGNYFRVRTFGGGRPRYAISIFLNPSAAAGGGRGTVCEISSRRYPSHTGIDSCDISPLCLMIRAINRCLQPLSSRIVNPSPRRLSISRRDRDRIISHHKFHVGVTSLSVRSCPSCDRSGNVPAKGVQSIYEADGDIHDDGTRISSNEKSLSEFCSLQEEAIMRKSRTNNITCRANVIRS